MIAPLDPDVASHLASLGLHFSRRKDEVTKTLDEAREIWCERAAIREYCGGMTRWHAEQHALADTIEVMNERVGKR